MTAVLKRMIDQARPVDEIALVADGLALRWLLDNSTVQPDDRGEWALVYISTDIVPLSRHQAVSAIRNAAGIDPTLMDMAIMG